MQKKIIIPTDFSDVAIMVEQTALSLATRMGAEAIFVSCVKGENPGEFFDGEDGNVPYFLKDEFNAFKERRKISDPSHRLLFTHDTLPEAIHQLKATEDIALIVMGSSGTHGLKQLWGSNAQKVGRIAACPVLVIKQDTSPTFFSQIMFASNFRHEAKQAFENFVSFAKLFGSHIHLVYVTTLKTDMVENKLASQKMQAFRQMCGDLRVSQHMFGDVNTSLGIEHFANDNQIDLVAMMSHQDGFLSRLMRGGSTSEALLNRLEQAMMILPDINKKVLT